MGIDSLFHDTGKDMLKDTQEEMDYKREILLFEYFFFKPLDYSELAGYPQENNANAGLKDIYTGWIGGYWHKAQLFYQSQYRRHQDITWLSFCQHYQIPEYQSVNNLSLDYEWADWKENYRLNDHFDRYQMTVQELSTLSDTLPDRTGLKTTDSKSDEVTVYKELDKIWFNGLINNSSDVMAKLRSISYEKYLETTHWKKIRAAMILINSAICQAAQCSIVGESWYGGNESDLEVHHLDYSNRGNERFNDLALLCKRHHITVHQNLSESGKPGLELV